MAKINTKNKDEELQYLRQRVAKLEEAEDRYRTLIELGTKIGEAVIMLQDIDGREGVHTYVSDQWSQITGYSKEELLTMSFFNLVKPEDRQLSLNRHRLKMAGKTMSDLFELTVICKDRREITAELTSAATTYRGKPANVIYIRDITERKKAERLLEKERDRYIKLLQNAPVAIWELDCSEGMPFINSLRDKGVTDFEEYFNNHPDSFAQFLNNFNSQKVLNYNDACLKLFGADNPAIGLRIVRQIIAKLGNSGLTPQEDSYLKGMIKEMSRLISGNINHETLDYNIRNAAGDSIYIQSCMSVMPGHEQDLSWVYATAVDITNRVEAEIELKKYKDHLEDVIKERTLELEESRQKEHELYQSESLLRRELENRIKQQIEFTHRLIHDLKTPLSPMLTASDILLHQNIDENIHRIALNINRGANRLNHSINDLVDYIRGEVHVLKLECLEVDIKEILTEVVEFFNIEAERNKQVIVLDIQEVVTPAWADPERLKQVVMNLIENALRYAPNDSNIIVQAKEKGEVLVIEVIDAGPGITKEDLPFVFEPYYSSSKNLKQTDGLGLGLPLAKTIIELHKGKIWVKSQPNEETVFGFSIPIKRPVLKR